MRHLQSISTMMRTSLVGMGTMAFKRQKNIARRMANREPSKTMTAIAATTMLCATSVMVGSRPAQAIHAVCSFVDGGEQDVLVVQGDDCSSPFDPFFGGPLALIDPVHAVKDVTIDGTTTLGGASNINGNSTFAAGSTATFNGAAVFNGGVKLASTLSTSGISNTGNISTDTLSTTGLATLNSLSVTNNASIGGTLNVAGLATFNGVVNHGNIATDTLTATTLIAAPLVNATTLNATTVNATTMNAATVAATTVNATDVNATNVKATTVAATTVNASTVNATMSNIGTANVTSALQVARGAAVNIGGNRVQNVAAPISGSDAANKSYVDASVASLGGQVEQALSGVNTRLDDIASRTTKATAGVAMAFAMAGVPTVLPTERVAFTMNYGNFQGQNGVAINGAVRLNDNFQLTGGVGYSTAQSLVGARAGLRVGW
ncbi:YadA-like family protein [Bradyrhizobium tropiciagri]|uniref:YadA-like family protein n=1 Tax=Bradyrhizobium tropiciagri TaxID=312253 RepID=UPI001009F108|nr:YadA-like family protein [Bradyrhizobium tropiciagri]